MSVKLSLTTKLDGVKSWSLQAGDTCPGSFDSTGNLVDACSGCYAKSGTYHYSNVKKPRIFNRTDWKRDEWVTDMVSALINERYFRWFDSGDMYSLSLAEKIYQVMVLTPHVKHWLPTRMVKFAKFRTIIEKMKSLDNVMVRFSSDSVMGEFVPGLHGSTILPNASNVPNGVTVCHSFSNAGKCGSCRKCYDKDIPVIGYVQHGQVMGKIIRLKLAA